ncbi:ArsR/SmtB family transcription factor [Companilactobacillus farciminis]|jgi:ArsR family transcriptional regulator|uniref:ArsR/SmtB family transcription factor n=1 Tax=Companilactobacillus farciminis TaxID=1612 RepID=UPI00232CEE36|nr:transcriptional regulator [Companilactobacillus farciminis]WCG34844.1 transcriptional regulator [Companilactobacillus farciminis]
MKIDVNIFKVLSNQTRLDILKWLKNPEIEITSVPCETVKFMMTEKGGICVQDLVIKAGLAQSTVSSYLTMMEKCHLLLSERHGKWTYYRRNEMEIQNLGKLIAKDL